jgi:hypothetical protein
MPLCWRDDYVKFGQLLDVDLANQPELAMDREIAYAVMATGMLQGLFTGKRLADYIAPESHEGKADYYNARRVLDSMTKARVVASHAKHFELALNLPTRG